MNQNIKRLGSPCKQEKRGQTNVKTSLYWYVILLLCLNLYKPPAYLVLCLFHHLPSHKKTEFTFAEKEILPLTVLATTIIHSGFTFGFYFEQIANFPIVVSVFLCAFVVFLCHLCVTLYKHQINGSTSSYSEHQFWSSVYNRDLEPRDQIHTAIHLAALLSIKSVPDRSQSGLCTSPLSPDFQNCDIFKLTVICLAAVLSIKSVPDSNQSGLCTSE